MATMTATPRTWTVGELVSAANLNAQLHDLIAAHGAFGSYTPTFSGWTQGNGVVQGAFMQIQKTVIFRASFTLGSTSAALSATPKFTLPVTGALVNYPTLSARFTDANGSRYLGVGSLNSATVVEVWALGANGVWTSPAAAYPFTWASTDSVEVSGVYEAA